MKQKIIIIQFYNWKTPSGATWLAPGHISQAKEPSIWTHVEPNSSNVLSYFLQKLRVTATWDIIAQGGTFMLWKKYPSWMRVVTSNPKCLQSYFRSHHLPTTMLCVKVWFWFCFLKSTSSSLCTILVDEGTLSLLRIRAPWEQSWALGYSM